MKTGFIGGTFDPPHYGHLIVAESIRCAAKLDKIIFMPAAVSPHKIHYPSSSSGCRWDMLKLAIKGHQYFDACDYELKKGGVSYTIDTVSWITRESQFKNNLNSLIIGADSLLEFETWKSFSLILELADVLVAVRPEFNLKNVSTDLLRKVTVINTPMIDISSTGIRARINKELPVKFWTPDAVVRYIDDNGLYRS
ncbi:nicotinate-nucleotide adenylyltransferase [bacterium]|nr:nicotinate-nucleotide adenylyltransferase [bacterium]